MSSLGTHPRRGSPVDDFFAILPHTILYTSTSFTKPIDHSVEPFVAIMSVLPWAGLSSPFYHSEHTSVRIDWWTSTVDPSLDWDDPRIHIFQIRIFNGKRAKNARYSRALGELNVLRASVKWFQPIFGHGPHTSILISNYESALNREHTYSLKKKNAQHWRSQCSDFSLGTVNIYNFTFLIFTCQKSHY